jgi:hypothetical protein
MGGLSQKNSYAIVPLSRGYLLSKVRTKIIIHYLRRAFFYTRSSFAETNECFIRKCQLASQHFKFSYFRSQPTYLGNCSGSRKACVSSHHQYFHPLFWYCFCLCIFTVIHVYDFKLTSSPFLLSIFTFFSFFHAGTIATLMHLKPLLKKFNGSSKSTV